MSIFDFLKRKSKEDYYGKEITFTIDNVYIGELSNCKVGDYVTLWTKPKMDRVIIYRPVPTNEMGELGIVPNTYFKIIKSHILGEKSYGFSGPLTHNYNATILNISGSSCTIELKLFSPEEHEKKIMNMIDKEKQSINDKLEKPYKMKNLVLIKFNIIDVETVNLEDLKLKLENLDNLKLKIFDKEYYIEHPDNYKLHLVDNTNKLLAAAEVHSQRHLVYNVVKGYFDGQKMIIKKIDFEGSYLNVLISAE